LYILASNNIPNIALKFIESNTYTLKNIDILLKKAIIIKYTIRCMSEQIMLNKLKFPAPSENFNVFYVSCLHFGHNKEFLYKPRGFNSVEEHDSVVTTRWNERVTNNDVVHSIGDTLFGENGEARLIKHFNELNFSKLFLSPGNHFAGWHQAYRELLNLHYGKAGLDTNMEIYPLELRINLNKSVYFMPNYYEIYVGKQGVVLCHYPIFPHNGAGKGVWGVFGHCHGNNPKTHKNTGTGKVIDVCVESFGGPVSHLEIEEIFKTRADEDVHHHGPKTTYTI